MRAGETLPGLAGADDRGHLVLAEVRGPTAYAPTSVKTTMMSDGQRPPLAVLGSGQGDIEAGHERDVDLHERAAADIQEHLAGAGAVARTQQLDEPVQRDEQAAGEQGEPEALDVEEERDRNRGDADDGRRDPRARCDPRSAARSPARTSVNPTRTPAKTMNSGFQTSRLTSSRPPRPEADSDRGEQVAAGAGLDLLVGRVELRLALRAPPPRCRHGSPAHAPRSRRGWADASASPSDLEQLGFFALQGVVDRVDVALGQWRRALSRRGRSRLRRPLWWRRGRPWPCVARCGSRPWRLRPWRARS